MATLAFMLTHPAVEDIGINVMAYGQRSQRYATSQILRHQFCFELRTVTPAPANLLGIVLCHYKHPLIISWVLSLAYLDGAEKMPSPDVYVKCNTLVRHLVPQLYGANAPFNVFSCTLRITRCMRPIQCSILMLHFINSALKVTFLAKHR